MFHGIHTGTQSSGNGLISVGMDHDGKALLVGDVDQLHNLLAGQTGAGKAAEGGKIHNSGNHKLDKIAPGLPNLMKKTTVVCQGLIGPAKKAAVVSCFIDGKSRLTVVYSHLLCQHLCPAAYTPGIAAVS